MHEKLERLKNDIEKMGSLAVAFSGGVDSTFLLKVAYDVLKSRTLAVTVRSETFPEREFRQAVLYAEQIGVDMSVIAFDEFEIEGYSQNPVDRCYHCKKELFGKILDISKKKGIRFVVDGSNFDDLSDTRPGMKALRELSVASPLIEAGLRKSEIRQLSKEMGLPGWERPSFACLASRFPYGQEITKEKLKVVEAAEQFLLDLGLKQVRVRHHGNIARIEVSRDELKTFFNEDLMDRVARKFKEIGFPYTTLDMQGYRTGSLNEVLKKN